MSLAGSAPVVNNSTEPVPPRGVMVPDGTVDAEGRLGVGKPAAADLTAVLFNGPTQLAPGAAGQGFHPHPRAVASADLADLPLAAGAVRLGTRAGDWRLRPGGTGFVAVTPVYAGDLTVIPESAAAVPAGFFVKLAAKGTTTGQTTRYSWAEWAVDSSGSVVVPGGRSGALTVGFAEDIGGVADPLLVGTFQYLTPNPLRPGAYLFDAKLCSTFEAVTNETISGCTVSITYTTFQLLPQPKTTVALSTRTTTITIPSACVEVVTNVTGSIACVSGAPVLTLTQTKDKVRVLDCGTCP